MVHVKKPWPIAVQGTFHITGSVPTNSSAKSLKPLAQAIRSAAHGWVLAAFAETAMPGGCFRLHGVVDLGGSPVAFQDAEMPLNAMPCAVHWFFSFAFGCLDRFPFAVRSFQPGSSCLQDMLPWLESCIPRVMHIGCVHHSRASTQPARSAKRGVS